MIDNINKLSSNLDSNRQQQQQTAASIVNLTDDGEIVKEKKDEKNFFLFATRHKLDKERKKTRLLFISHDLLNHI